MKKSVQKVTEMDKGTRKRFVNVTPVKSDRLKVNPARLVDLVDLEQLDFKVQHSVCWDYGWKPTSPVCIISGHCKNSLLINGQLGNTLVPPLDHLANADLCNERTVPISARIEFLSVFEGTYIVNRDGITALGEVLPVPWRYGVDRDALWL